jgi:phosphoglycerate dehydrogenase-like enzyme
MASNKATLAAGSSFAVGAAAPVVRLLIPRLPAAFTARLEALAGETGRRLELCVAETQQEAIERLGAPDQPAVDALVDAVEMGATAAGAPTRWACDDAVLRAAPPSLAWVQSGQAGQDAAPLALFAERGVVLTNAANITGSHLAEHIMALLLAFSRCGAAAVATHSLNLQPWSAPLAAQRRPHTGGYCPSKVGRIV